VAPETLPFSGGSTWSVDALADELAELPEIDGVTLSGGEPTAQASALCRLIDRVRARRDLSFLCYSGFTLEHLRAHGGSSVAGLLEKLDLLIDGPYLRERHTDLRWRGSDNQRVHFLSSRHADLMERVNDRGNWLEVSVEGDALSWMGIPPPGFRALFEATLTTLGIVPHPEAPTRERIS
jgi:anaerobic ribonucleoside-triphosphate reductase activating protein